MRRRVVALSVVLALGCLTASPSVGDDKDDLKQRQGQVGSQIAGAQQDLEESSAGLLKATKALAASQASLSTAQANLASTRTQLAAAQARDVAMAAALTEAEATLKSARADAKAGRKAYSSAAKDAERATVASLQGGSPSLRALSALVHGVDPATYGSQVSIEQTVVAARTASLDRLDASRVMRDLHRKRVQQARDAVKAKREEAAANLAAKKQLEADAETQTAQVAELVQANTAAQGAAARAKQADAAQLASLQSERSRISTRLKRIAAAERRAAERERQRRLAEAQRRKSGEASRGSGTKARASGGGGGGGSSSSYDGGGGTLSYPAKGPITSRYGMRFHPILHVWKLHDGTDFGVPCGTPVHAAASGRVIAKYYNAGYGNRIIISHGIMRGESVATTYNHLSKFKVSVGEKVQRGELIGYSGTTGYSTGCHLHFMVLVNGDTVNPMSWL